MSVDQRHPPYGGGEGLSNGYIHDVLKHHIQLSRRFVDVYAADTINITRLRRKDKFIFISNLAKSGETGTHFVCVVGTSDRLLYLDSFGQSPRLSPTLYTKLKSLGRKIVLQYKSPIQSMTSDFCGMYCIYFACLHDDIRMADTQGILPFSSAQLKKNDALVMYNIKSLLKNNPMPRRQDQ